MVKVKKIKKKTHKATKKVLNVRNSGSISMCNQGVLHNTGKKSSKTNRQKRKGTNLDKSDYKRIKDLI